MAPIKFEDNLKEKLEQRKMQPSTKAWETLQERLDADNNKKNNKGLWWIGIAASFVGILIIASVFFNKDIKQNVKPTLVDVEEVKESQTINKTIIPNKVEEKIAIQDSKIEKETINVKQEIPIKQKKLIKKINKDVVVQFETETPNNKKEKDIKAEAKLSFEDIKLQEVVTLVNELKKNNQTVSDADIDALLVKAQKEIALNNLYNESTKTVDAEALLQDVEADLEQTFRERAFKAIESGFEYVKTEVAERNN